MRKSNETYQPPSFGIIRSLAELLCSPNKWLDALEYALSCSLTDRSHRCHSKDGSPFCHCYCHSSDEQACSCQRLGGGSLQPDGTTDLGPPPAGANSLEDLVTLPRRFLDQLSAVKAMTESLQITACIQPFE